MRCPTRAHFLVVLAVVPAAFALGAGEEPRETGEFERVVRPFLKTYCLGCHQGDEPRGGLDLTTFASMRKGGESGEASFLAGKPDESLLLRMLEGAEEPRMPPAAARKQPSKDEIAAIRKWIESGAPGPVVDAPQTGLPETPRIAPRKARPEPVRAVAFGLGAGPDASQRLAVAVGSVVVIDNGEESDPSVLFRGAQSRISALAVDSAGERLAAVGGTPGIEGEVTVWKSDGSLVARWNGHSDMIDGAAFIPGRDRIATGSYDRLIRLWNLPAGEPGPTLQHHTGAVARLAAAPDGTALFSVSADATVKIWNPETGERIATLTESTKGLEAVAVHPRGTEFAAAGADRMLRIWSWNGRTARLRKSGFAHDAAIVALAWSPDGNTIYTASQDRRVKAWSTESLQERFVYPELPDWPTSLAVSSDGRRVAVGCHDGSVSWLDAGSPALLLRRAMKVAAREPDTPPAKGGIANSCGVPGTAPLFVALVSSVVEPPAGFDPDKPLPPRPRLDSVSPRTTVRGQRLTVTLHGKSLADADILYVEPSHLVFKLLPADPARPDQRACELTLPPEMAPGFVSFRLRTPLAMTAAQSLYVGPFTETGEREPNDAAAQAAAQPTSLPATLVGTIAAKGDRDLWAFEAAAGAEIVFWLTGASLGSALQGQLRILNGQGETVAASVRQPGARDVVLGHKFADSGVHFLEVSDRFNTGGGGHSYWIHAGAFAYVSGTFPLGLPAGENRRVTLRGFNLGEAERTLSGTPGTRFVHWETPVGKTLNASRIEFSPAPVDANALPAEIVESEPNGAAADALPFIDVPGAVNGRIDSPGDADLVPFWARPGDKLTIEVFARRVGSPLDSVVEVLDESGRPVPRAVLRCVAETYTVLRDHSSRAAGIRLQAWDDFRVNDHLLIGSEVVRVRVLPLGPDEDVKFFERDGLRLGYLGTTPQAQALGASAYKVEIHPPGATFPPNGLPVVTLNYANDDGGPGFQSDSVVPFDVPGDPRADAAPRRWAVRVRDVRGDGSADHVYRLVVRPRKPDFRLSISPQHPNVPRGGALPITVTADRLDGFEGRIDLDLLGLPPGFTAAPGRIDAGFFQGTVMLYAAADAVSSRDGAGELQVLGRAVIDGTLVTHGAPAPPSGREVTVTLPPELETSIEPAAATIRPGEELRVTATIRRQYGFSGRVPIDVLGLPHGVRVLDVGLNGVLIPEGETSRTFVITCDDYAEPGEIQAFVAARNEGTGERHAAPPLRLVVEKAK